MPRAGKFPVPAIEREREIADEFSRYADHCVFARVDIDGANELAAAAEVSAVSQYLVYSRRILQ